MNVARLNFSHGTYDEQLNKFNLIKQVRQELGLPIAIMLDTKGPEYRIKTFKEHKVTLKDGDEPIGAIDVVNYIDGDPEIGYCLSKKYWNQGLMTEACKAFAKYLFINFIKCK